MKRLWLVILCASCTNRPLTYMPADAAVSAPANDMAMVGDMAPSLQPCHLIAVGEPFQTIHFDGPGSDWRNDGVLARAGNKVVPYGTVQLRFGGWDDPAMYAAEYDTTSWPPTTIQPQSELYGTVHSPTSMIDVNGQMAAVFYSDHDGLGPVGIDFRTINEQSFQPAPELIIAPSSEMKTVPSSLGTRGTVATFGYMLGTTVLDIFDQNGTSIEKITLDAQVASGSMATGRLQTDDFLVSAPTVCNGDMGCGTGSIDVFRRNNFSLTKVASVNAPIEGSTVSSVILLSDHQSHHFLTWWEAGPRTSLFGIPLDESGVPTGPAEVWFTTSNGVNPQGRGPSIGKLGMVYPIDVSVPTDGGRSQEIHLIQRQLTANAPITDTVITARLSSYTISTTQQDSPRALIVSYSNYSTTPLTKGGYGVLAKYVCSED